MNYKVIRTYKLRAFTLLDLLTGMVLMSIVIGMVYYLFTSVNKQLIVFSKNKTELQEQQLMRSDLTWNNNKANALVRNPLGFDFIFEDDNTIHIERHGEILLRIDKRRTDTLTKRLVDIKYMFTRDNLDRETDLIQHITVISKVTEVNLSFVLNKSYSSAEKINKLLMNEY